MDLQGKSKVDYEPNHEFLRILDPPMVYTIFYKQVGLNGEAKNLISPNGISTVEWSEVSLVKHGQQPLKWYKAYFDAPTGNEPLALDMKSMGRGQVWVNGQSIGRYWTVHANGKCGRCQYPGAFRPGKCQAGCGLPTQRW